MISWLVAGALVFSACSSRSERPELRIQVSADPVSLDPSLAEDGISLRILMNTMDGLVGYDPQGNLELRLAESYRFSKDGKEIEFTLKKEIQWSDDQPVTAKDFVTGLRRSLAPETASKLARVLSAVRAGAEGVFERDGKVVVRLNRRAPYLIEAMAMSQALPQREDVLSRHHGVWPVDGPVTGPYRIAEYKIGQSLHLVPNELYWRGLTEGRGVPLGVRLLIVQDEATAKNLFEQGRLDILTRVSQYDLERYRTKGWLHTDPFPATYYLSFNQRKAPFTDRRVRRAFSVAVNKDEIVQTLRSGEIAATGWIPPGIEGHLAQDPTLSRREAWLRDYRAHPLKADSAAVHTGLDSSARNFLVMEKAQQDIERALGVHLLLENMDWKSYVKSLASDPPPLFRFAWLAPFRDPVVQLQVFVTGNPNNYSGWSNAEYDRLVSQIEESSPGAAREAKIIAAQKILADEAVLIPLYHYVQVNAVKPEVEGFIVNPFGWIPFHHLRKRLP